jgi:hypothetical protein
MSSKNPIRAGLTAFVAFAWLSLSPVSAHAAAFVLEIEALIDGRDQLIVQGNTLQWHHFDFSAVGRHQGQNLPTIISTQLNGVTLMDRVEWIPDWSAPPPNGIVPEEFSSVFNGLTPALPFAELSVQLIEIESRNSTTIVELPTAANGFSTIIEFNDNPAGSSEIYIARLEFDIVTEAPEPGAVALFGIGLLGIGLIRRKSARH